MRLLLTVPLVLAIAVPADAGPRRGKIVRVERPRTGGRGAPRICQYSPTDSSGNCFGLPPTVGEVASIVTNDGVSGQVRVNKVEAQMTGGGTSGASCSTGLWRTEVELIEGDKAAQLDYGGWMIFDLPLAASATVTQPPANMPDGASADQAALSVNRDGIADADFLVTWYPCQGNGNAPSGAQVYCIDFWVESGARWNKARQDVVSWCM